MIQLITDSTAYLTKALIGNYPIEIVSLSVLIDEDIFVESETDNEVFYARMAQGQSFPKSAQPRVDKMMRAFEEAVLKGYEIIGTFLSSDMSGTYQTACMVKDQLLEKYPDARIEIIDSRTNSMQMGLCVLHGAALAEQGKSLEMVAEAMRNHVNRSRFVFLPATLDYLKMGGRIGGAKALLGSILQILPILTVKEGRTEVLQNVRTKKKAVETLLQIVLEDIKKYELDHVIVHHIECYEEGLVLAKRLEDELGTSVTIVDIGPVIGTHVGPGAIGIAYDVKRPFED